MHVLFSSKPLRQDKICLQAWQVSHHACVWRGCCPITHVSFLFCVGVLYLVLDVCYLASNLVSTFMMRCSCWSTLWSRPSIAFQTLRLVCFWLTITSDKVLFMRLTSEYKALIHHTPPANAARPVTTIDITPSRLSVNQLTIGCPRL